MSTQDPGDGVIAGRHKVGIRVLDPEPVSKTEAPAPDPETASGKELMNARLQQRKMLAQSRRKNRARDDAPTVSFGGKVHRFLVPKQPGRPGDFRDQGRGLHGIKPHRLRHRGRWVGRRQQVIKFSYNDM